MKPYRSFPRIDLTSKSDIARVLSQEFGGGNSRGVALEQQISKESEATEREKLLDSYYINRYIEADARTTNLPPSVANLIVTSPPYNVGVNYSKWNDNLPIEEYKQFIRDWLTEAYRILDNGGRLCIVIANVGRNPYISNTVLYTVIAEEIGFEKRGEIIWQKFDSPNGTTWGSWLSAADPSLRDMHEYILVFHKGNKRRDATEKTVSIDKETFLTSTGSCWRINTVRKKESLGHPAAFPEEIPRRLIELYSFVGDVVIDMFCGIGTTCRVAEKLNRIYIGIDLDLSFVKQQKAKQHNQESKKVSEQLANKKYSIGITGGKIKKTEKKYLAAKKRKEKLNDGSSS